MQRLRPLLLACTFPALAPAADAVGTAPEPLFAGDRSEVHAVKVQRVRSQREWSAVWAELGARSTRAQPPPAIDFAAGHLLAFFAGDQRTGGVSVAIGEVEVKADHLTLVVHMDVPGAGCVATTALSQPFQVVRIPRDLPERPIDFRYLVERRACPPGSPPVTAPELPGRLPG